jgi:hypothetical protein
MSEHADQFENDAEHDPAGDQLREQQEGKGYGGDEGERESGLDREDAPDS